MKLIKIIFSHRSACCKYLFVEVSHSVYVHPNWEGKIIILPKNGKETDSKNVHAFFQVFSCGQIAIEQWKEPGCLGYIGDKTTQLYADYYNPIIRIPTKQPV